MKFLEYLKPDNPFALEIVYGLVWLFVLWYALLLWNTVRGLLYQRQIGRCEDVDELAAQSKAAPASAGTRLSSLTRDKTFRAFREAKRLRENSPVAQHLYALFAAGWNESNLDVRGLIKNTNDRLFRAHSLQRALLSVFIILGLLGTLFGLADALALLADALRGGTQVDNARLNQGLQTLLGSLKGAFGPSILGVFLTVVGVLLFALYLRLIAAPLGGLLERSTLTVWVPSLMPTASQKLLDKLQLSEMQMQKSFDAAKTVADFAENIQNKTGAFGQTLEHATESLARMEKVSDRLTTFSESFVKGAEALAPELRSLYQQMLKESRAFQESVARNISGAEDFQNHIRAQLNGQHEQLSEVLKSLRSYEDAYVKSRGGIDAKLEDVLARAEEAFKNLSLRNDEIGRALDASLGTPLREDLTRHLSAVEKALDSRLEGVESTLQVELGALGDRLGKLDAPLNKAAEEFTKTFFNFNEHTSEWRETLQREFAQQNETSQTQLRRLDVLSEVVPELLKQLSASSNTFTTGGQQLSQDISALSQNVAALGRNVDALGQQVGSNPNGDERTAGLLAQQINILRELSNRLERMASVRSSAVVVSDGSSFHGAQRKPRLRDRIKGWIPFIGRD